MRLPTGFIFDNPGFPIFAFHAKPLAETREAICHLRANLTLFFFFKLG